MPDFLGHFNPDQNNPSADDRKLERGYKKYSRKEEKLPRIMLDQIHDPGDQPNLATKIKRRAKSHLIEHRLKRESRTALDRDGVYNPPDDRKDVVDRLDVDKHLRLDIERWGEQEKTLEDGTALRKGDLVAQIHILSDSVEQKTTPDYLRRFYKELLESLKHLASMTAQAEQAEGSTASLAEVKAFYGTSYLMNSKLAEKMGFETEAIEDDTIRLLATRKGYGIIANVQSRPAQEAQQVGDRIRQFGEQYEKKKKILTAKRFTPAKNGFMSREKLLELYGEKAEGKKEEKVA